MPGAAAYEAHRRRMQRRLAETRALAAEIGELPPIIDQERRDSAEHNFRIFCEQYRPRAFNLQWSEDHLRIIDKIESTVLNGGLFAMAMPRGSGKTTLTITAALWSLLYGHRQWVCLVGATASKAESLLKSVKTELRFNLALLDDFPEICYPIRRLEGRANKAASQTYGGVPTSCVWMTDSLVLPTIENAAGSGGKITVCGITGDIRGQQDTQPDGSVRRPDYVICDDPQTRDSAKSRQQTDDRIATINGDVLGLAGPNVKISGIIPCTVIQRGDLADQLLDREIAPLWYGIRTQLLNGFPKNTKLWDEYQEIRNADAQADGDGTIATKFYEENREAMDEGCAAAWPDRYNDDEISAIQHAMNIFGRDPVAFWSEYQNEPMQSEQESGMLSRDEIAKRISEFGHYQVPQDAEVITGMIDVQKELLYYTIVAWKKDYTGWVVDYGSWPDQRTTNFVMTRARHTFSKRWPTQSFEVCLQRALTALTDELLARVWTRDDGAEMSINRLLIDANWGQARDNVYNFCRNSKHRSVIMPCHGKYIGPESEPINARHVSKSRGKTMGLHWRIAKAKDSPVRHVLFDANFWKSAVHARFATEPFTSGSLTLWKASPKTHATYASHMTAEYPTRVSGRNREIDVWRIRPSRDDNHWFDCTTGAAVAASMLGCSLFSTKKSKKQAAVEPGGESPAEEAKPKKKKRRSVEYL